MSRPNWLTLPQRALRHLFFDHSYERYYTSDKWDEKYTQGYELNNPKEDGRYGVLLGLLTRHCGGGPILDAGCGDGLLAAKLRRVTDVRIVGVDYADRAVAHAKERNLVNATFACDDFRHFRPDERFTVIVFNEALYYVDDYMEVLEIMRQHLVDDGVFIISMFDTLVTARIWKRVRRYYEPIQGASVSDEASGQSWQVRVLQPAT